MAFDHETDLAGYPLIPFEPGQRPGDLSRVGVDLGLYGEDYGDKDLDPYMSAFLAEPWAGEVRALALGWNSYSGGPDMGGFLPYLRHEVTVLRSLRHLLLGNCGREECEVSWLSHGKDYGPLLDAYPKLETFWVRGNSPTIGIARHDGLTRLIVQSGGLGGNTVRQIAAAELPALEELELWFGVKYYGCSTTIDDLRPILKGDRLSSLRRLALVNLTHDEPGRLAEAIPEALADAPILTRLEELDLRGTPPSPRVMEILAGIPAVRTVPRLRLSVAVEKWCPPTTSDALQRDQELSCGPQPTAVPGLDNVVLEPFVIVSE